MADLEKIVAGTGVRGRYRDLGPFLSDADPGKAYAQYFSAAPATPMGHFEATINTTPSGLPNLPAGCRRAVIYAISNGFTYTDDGTAPSSSHGMKIPADTHFIYDTDPDENFQMWAGVATEIRVAYYG